MIYTQLTKGQEAIDKLRCGSCDMLFENGDKIFSFNNMDTCVIDFVAGFRRIIEERPSEEYTIYLCEKCVSRLNYPSRCIQYMENFRRKYEQKVNS